MSCLLRAAPQSLCLQLRASFCSSTNTRLFYLHPVAEKPRHDPTLPVQDPDVLLSHFCDVTWGGKGERPLHVGLHSRGARS